LISYISLLSGTILKLGLAWQKVEGDLTEATDCKGDKVPGAGSHETPGVKTCQNTEDDSSDNGGRERRSVPIQLEIELAVGLGGNSRDKSVHLGGSMSAKDAG
jgi:hypothetical protein